MRANRIVPAVRELTPYCPQDLPCKRAQRFHLRDDYRENTRILSCALGMWRATHLVRSSPPAAPCKFESAAPAWSSRAMIAPRFNQISVDNHPAWEHNKGANRGMDVVPALSRREFTQEVPMEPDSERAAPANCWLGGLIHGAPDCTARTR